MDRVYSAKDVEMLTAISIITDNAIANKPALIAKRATWKDPFFPNLKTDIDKTIVQHLGLDNYRNLRQATQDLLGVQTTALGLLSELKVQIEEDFSSNTTQRDELLNNLGFNTYYKDAKGKDQEALINLLYRLQSALTPPVQTQITTAGTDPATLTTLSGLAQTLKNKNITQETFKGTGKRATAADVQAFNAIYNRVSSVARISARLFRGNSTLTSLFSFRKIVDTLNSHPGSAAAPPPANQ